MKELYTASITEQEKMTLSNLRGSENTAEKLEIMIEYHRLELGLRISIFDNESYQYLGIATKTWLVKVIKRMRAKKVKIQTKKKILCLGESQTIMECALNSDTRWEG